MAARNAFWALSETSVTRRTAVGIGAFAALGLIGCSGGQEEDVSESEPDQKDADSASTPAAEPEPEEPDPADWTEVELTPAPELQHPNGETFSPSDWHWCDGVLATGVWMQEYESSSDFGKCSFAVWNPVSGLRFEFYGTLQDADEELIGGTPKIIASYGEAPVAWIIYRVRKSASGLDPESTHLYASRINFEEGELEERVELPDGDFNDTYDELMTWVPSTEDYCGIMIATDYEESTNKGDGANQHVLALDEAGQATDYYQKEWRYDAATSASGIFIFDDYYGDRQWMYDLDTGSAIFEEAIDPTTGAFNSVMPLGENRYLANVYNRDRIEIIDPSDGVTSLADKIDALFPDGNPTDPSFAASLHDGSAILGIGGCIAKIDPMGNVSAILDVRRGEALGIEVMGVDPMTGDIYVKTTDENVIIDVSGADAGRWTVCPWSAQPTGESYSVVRVDVRKVEAVLFIPEGRLDETSSYTVTRGGAPGSK